MKLTKHLLSRAEALKLAPAYVKWIETRKEEWCLQVLGAFEDLRVGQWAVTWDNGTYVLVRVTSRRCCGWMNVDGPVVRVGNGEYTWRVDGSGYAYPVTTVAKNPRKLKRRKD
jgi:hypothetical protein